MGVWTGLNGGADIQTSNSYSSAPLLPTHVPICSSSQMLAESMMALLPGIDANDEGKTEAVLHLFTMVLACVPALGEPGGDDGSSTGGGLVLPLYADEVRK